MAAIETKDGKAEDGDAETRVSGSALESGAKRYHPLFGLPRGAVVAGMAMVVAALGAVWIFLPPSSEATDDAYVEADSTTIAPRVHGFIEAIEVGHNVRVMKGQVLARIDPEEFRARLSRAEADVASAEASEASMRAALQEIDAEEKLAEIQISSTNAAMVSARAESSLANTDMHRYAKLVKTDAVSRSMAERYETAAVTARQKVVQTASDLAVARQNVNVIGARRAVQESSLRQAQAQLAQAKSALRLAEQDMRHTVIRAPIDGVVADRQANVGDYVQPGSRLLTIVPVSASYVTAYFKETQISRMRPGQRVDIDIDALDGKNFVGSVDSLAPGSGSQFSLLPFEPGTGNFTKIVQRVPVRIRFDAGQPGLADIRAGLSATVRVHLEKPENGDPS